MNRELIYDEDSVYAMLDRLLERRADGWWNDFYADRAKPCPFFVDKPDENLVRWIDEGAIRTGRALDLGCGNGRNAIYLARKGFTVDAIDYSQTAINWAKERAQQAQVAIALHCTSVFDFACDVVHYDFVYDSGCFHHVAPHRRRHYVEWVNAALKPGARFGLVCFNPEGGSGYTDADVYERRSLGGGLGYSAEQLREIWSTRLRVMSVSEMTKCSAHDATFGEDFLFTLLAKKS